MMAEKPSLAIFTEASREIGIGHLLESLFLAESAKNLGFAVSFWVSQDCPASVLEMLPITHKFFSSLEQESEISKIRSSLIKMDYKALLFNFMKINNNAILSLKFRDVKTICIDELGGLNLDCDAIINPSIVEKYHCYFSDNKDMKLYTGPQYLSLGDKLAESHQAIRNFDNEIKNIVISMGGFDKSGTTLKLIDTLAELSPDIKKNIVLTAGFPYLNDARERMESLKNLNFKMYENVNNIESLFLEADVAFTAGGNTLYELACLGTPALVLYEDEHEKENGIAFEKCGFGFCVGRGKDADKKEILKMLERFTDAKVRYSHSLKGKEIVDGGGTRRILGVIRELYKNEHKPVKTAI